MATLLTLSLGLMLQVAGKNPIFDADQPPPTAYDMLVQQAPLGLAGESQTLLWYALRVVLGLLATLALIYLSVRLLLPKVVRSWPRGKGRAITMVERLPLDGRNAVVLLRMASGEHLLVGTGEHGVAFLTRLPAAAQVSHFATSMAHASQALERADEHSYAPPH